MHQELQETLELHQAIVSEASKALIGYETEKTLVNVVLFSEIPTTYDKDDKRQVNAGNILLRGVPGVGKTFFGVIIAAISNAKFARLQGRADLQPTEVVGFQMINPATGELITEFGPLASAEVILLDEINRIPLKSQSAFLEGLQDRNVTVGKTTYQLPAFSFAIATMNPIELGQGTFPLSEAATDRFAVIINIAYLPPEEEQKLVAFDFKTVHLTPLMPKERIIELRSVITREVFLHDALAKYIRRLVGATRPYSAESEWHYHSPSELVEKCVDLGASPRATICWGRLAKVWTLLQGRRDEVYPEDIQGLAKYVLGHRVWLGPHAASHGVTVEMVVNDIIDRVPGSMMHSEPRVSEPMVNPSDIAEIELFILKRMREFTLGDHASVFKGSGFNFVGSRDWEPGDRLSAIDWAQSSLTNFSPMIMREFEQDSTATIMAVADASLSTRCGVRGVPIAAAIARAVAAVGLSAVLFQDQFGMIAFDEGFRQIAAARPRIGKPHVIYCVDLYQRRRLNDAPVVQNDLTTTIEGHLRKTSLVPVISDFLFADAPRLIKELSLLNAVHDVFLMMADVRFAYRLPLSSAGWIETFDIETGQTRIVSLREFRQLAARVEEWQERVIRMARDEDLDILRVGLDRWELETTLVDFVRERRLRKM